MIKPRFTIAGLNHVLIRSLDDFRKLKPNAIGFYVNNFIYPVVETAVNDIDEHRFVGYEAKFGDAIFGLSILQYSDSSL